MQRYFLKIDDFNNNIITGDDVFHIKNVMRLNIGDDIIIICESIPYLVKITAVEKDFVKYKILNEINGNTELPFLITLFQGLPKGDKLDDIIKNSTQYGVTYIYPTIMKRSIMKIDKDKIESKLIRYNKIAKEAAEQSNRLIVPKIVDIIDLKKADFSNYNVRLICYEENAKNKEISNFKTIIKNLKENDSICVVVGPEGGIDEKEIEYLEEKGFKRCGLGPRIFRTENAINYVLASISYEWELKNE